MLTCGHRLLGNETMDAFSCTWGGRLAPLPRPFASSLSAFLLTPPARSCQLGGLDSLLHTHSLIGSAHCLSGPGPCLLSSLHFRCLGNPDAGKAPICPPGEPAASSPGSCVVPTVAANPPRVCCEIKFSKFSYSRRQPFAARLCLQRADLSGALLSYLGAGRYN